MFVFTPKPQILSVGERCSRLKQACEFEAELAARGAIGLSIAGTLRPSTLGFLEPLSCLGFWCSSAVRHRPRDTSVQAACAAS